MGQTIAIISALVLFFLFIAPSFLLSYIIYVAVLVRTNPGKWSRAYSVTNEEQLTKMYEIGQKWADEVVSYMSEVDITSEGFHLVGEYYDFGFEKSVIVVPGRMESLKYSYYYAIPYRDMGFNVLVTDTRSHGLSEGRYNSLGYKEYADVINWAKFLHDEKGNKEILLHGLCIGSSTCLFVMTSDKCPEYIKAMVSDGMFTRFYETFKTHMQDQNRPLFPFLYLVMMYIKIFTGANVITDGPIYRIEKMKKPVLFIHSKEDKYSLPEKSSVIYEKCTSDKTIKWFDKGAHSRIRINNTEEYDSTIKAFTEKYYA